MPYKRPPGAKPVPRVRQSLPPTPGRLARTSKVALGPADHPTRKARIKRASLRAAKLRSQGVKVLRDQPKRTKWWQQS